VPYPAMPASCDYAAVRQEFASLLGRDRKCVISGDIDGILSAVLLSHTMGWEVVGFYTLNDLWVSRRHLAPGAGDPESRLARSGLVFLDHDIYRSTIESIGHHLLQWSPDTAIPLHTEGRGSLNPNLLRGITKKEFGRKYPFGTFHFLLACASAWGLVRDFQPDDQVTTLLLHIDSSFVNAMNYQDNALDWLDWLGGSDANSPLNPICRRMLRFTPRVILEQSRNLAGRFKELGIRPRSQASVTDPTSIKQMETLRGLVAWFESETGWHARFADLGEPNLIRYQMDRRSTNPTRGRFQGVIADRPFSYAIIGSDPQGLNYNWFEGQGPPR